MGHKPSPRHQIDRINNDGNYEPGNCRWATPAENIQNSRGSKLTLDAVREIYRRVQAGEGYRTIAKEFGVAHTVIWKIHHKQIWLNATMETPPVEMRQEKIPMTQPEETVVELYEFNLCDVE